MSSLLLTSLAMSIWWSVTSAGLIWVPGTVSTRRCRMPERKELHNHITPSPNRVPPDSWNWWWWCRRSESGYCWRTGWRFSHTGFSDTGMLNHCSQLVGGDKEMVKVFKYKGSYAGEICTFQICGSGVVETWFRWVGLCLVLMMAGAVGSARMILRQHTLSQVVAGFLIGTACAYWGWCLYLL